MSASSRSPKAEACAVSINHVGYMLDPSNPEIVTTDMIFKHIDHRAQLVGPDHVGYGSDYIPDIT